MNHFWSAGGKGPIGTYIADRQLVRYYIDGETNSSIEFEPAMASGSGIGYERMGYYQKGCVRIIYVAPCNLCFAFRYK